MAYTVHNYSEFSLTGSSPVTFSYQVGGVTIYNGIGYARPSESTVKVRPNDIFSQYLGQTFPQLRDAVLTNADLVLTFTIVSGASSNYDYAYGSMGSLNNVHHAPITGRVEKGQYFICSCFKDTTVLRAYDDNQLATVAITPGAVGNYVIDTAHYSRGIEVSVNDSVEWSIVPKCHRFILYYVNEYGAWDSLVCEGAYKVTDGYERSETGVYPTAGQNEQTTQISKVFLNEIKRSYILNTGWLSDDEASRMHHLLGSCNVYICDTDNGNATYPVKITNADCPYKTFKNEGGMVNYEITVEQQTNITRR